MPKTTYFFNAWKPVEKFIWGAAPSVALAAASAAYDYATTNNGAINWGQLGAAALTGAVLSFKNYLAHKDKPSPPGLNGVGFGG